MPYKLFIQQQAKKKLQSLPASDRNRITEKIVMLGQNPDDESLDIKPLAGMPCFRLRVGNWRIIFERDDILKVIAIERLKPRGDAYK